MGLWFFLPQVSCSIFLFNLRAFDSYSGVLPQVRCFILFLFCLVLLLLALLGFLINFYFVMWSVCLCVLLCKWPLSALVKVVWAEGRGDYVLFIGCLIPLVAGVPISLVVLPHAFSVSVVSIFSGASPPLVASGHWAHWVLPHFYPPLYCHQCCQGLLVLRWYPPRAPVTVRLEPLSPVPAWLVQKIQGALCRDAWLAGQ